MNQNRNPSTESNPDRFVWSDISQIEIIKSGTSQEQTQQNPLSTAQIGKCGELLVQYRLLLLGIESAPMSTDTGIDLVAYSPSVGNPITIQVKTNREPKPSGGKGKRALDWWVPEHSPANFMALVDLSTENVWLLSPKDVKAYAQQQSGGRFHIYMYTDPSARPTKSQRLSHIHQFQHLLLSRKAIEVLAQLVVQPEVPEKHRHSG